MNTEIKIDTNEKLLALREASTSYGELKVLNKVNFQIDEGEIVAIMGPNGAGKSTVLKALFGLLPLTHGNVLWRGKNLNPIPYMMPEIGVALVPQGKRVFPHLSVDENLEIGGYFLKDKAEITRRKNEMYSLFPILYTKKKDQSVSLSGGQQQILAVARGMMSDPKVLLLDEPTLGLSPKIVQEMFELIAKVNAERKMAIVVVEHNLKSLLPIAHRAYVLERGSVVVEGSASEIAKSDILEKVFLGRI